MAKKEKVQPYFDNRLQYSSVLEAANNNAKGWRLTTIVAVIVALVAVGGAVYIGSQSKFIPVVIEIDGYGTPTRFYRVDERTNTNDERVTKAAIAKVITGIRTVSMDANYEKKVLDEVIYFFERSAPGFTRVQDYITAPATNPFKRAQDELVDVHINNVIKITKNTWQVEWKEIVRERIGKVKSRLAFKATVTLSQAEKITAEALYVNPTGILINDLVWSQQVNNDES